MARTEAYRVITGDSRWMAELPDETVHLVLTSPPYPMVAMWDELFTSLSCRSYGEMHNYLDGTWEQVSRVLVKGGIACINIGDATRTVDGVFRLYPNHSRVVQAFEKLGLVSLPYILWKKPTTKPHYKGKAAFLGSGFLPPNAYVTIDMEYILLFRKGNLRRFDPKDPARYTSKFTKPERDKWFSQVWTITGARQNLDGSEKRAAAFPEEIPYRLIRMFSILGDLVLDPFLGTGTSLKVAMRLGRRFVGYERADEMASVIQKRLGPRASEVRFTRQKPVIEA